MKDLDPSHISKWNFAMLRKKFSIMNIYFDAIFEEIRDVIIKTLISIEPHVCAKITKTRTAPHQCFDLFGFDILLDSSLKAWLLEVNTCPSLSSSAKLDKRIKTALLADVFHLIGINAFSHSEPAGSGYQNSEQRTFGFDFTSEDLKDEGLTKDDIDMLITFDEELNRVSDNVERIFPLKTNWRDYSKYFECERYNNYLLWKCINCDCKVLEKYKE